MRLRNQDGIVLPYLALLLLCLCGAGAFAADLGFWYARGAKLQKAADAAALAGVVWLPNNTQAHATAVEVLKMNGIDTPNINSVVDPSNDLEVVITPLSTHRLRVKITDRKVETILASVFFDSINMGRKAVAEYAPPVPMGSPANTFGTGNLIPGVASENIYAAVSGWCAPKEDGDQFLSGFDGNAPLSDPADKNSSRVSSCEPTHSSSGTDEDNTEYSDKQYTYIVELPPGRSTPVDVLVWDGAYFNTVDPLNVPANSPDSAFVTVPLQTITTTFRMFSPDGTPFDDDDNPEIGSCSGGETLPHTFLTNDRSGYDVTIAGSNRWRRLCTFAPSDPAGQYFLKVNTLQGELNSAGSNGYSLMLGDGSGALFTCDSRLVATCPRVYGKDAMSLYADQTGAQADFYLAEIDPIHAGKKMEIYLWDPGEGADKIRILDPNGNEIPFEFETIPAKYDSGGSPVTEIDVSPEPNDNPGPPNTRASWSKYNDRLVRIRITLPLNYTTLYGTNTWWKVRYITSAATVTDRTTWQLRVIGDPVHLINE